MKKILSFLAFAAIATFTACDKVEGPYSETSGGNNNNGDSIVKKVLLEDFTGHTCQGCPASHAEALRLQGIYGDRLIVMGIHAGYFAKPQTNPDGSYAYDFRNQTETDIATFFNVINQPFPKGMVGRERNTTTNAQDILDFTAWEGRIAAQLDEPALAGLKITNTFDSASRNITATVETKMVSAINDPVRLCVYMVEDSIVKWQKDGSTNIEFYTHRHALRGSLNGTWGDALSNPLTAGQIINTSVSGSLVPADANPDQCYLYAILYNDVTKEIIQVEEKKIK
ncbi:hypothetical protein BH11BAC2_BH11BAC2_01940 [soil metagenome]